MICPHLGQAIKGDRLVVHRSTVACGRVSERDKDFAVHECEILGRCNPKYKCDTQLLSEEIVAGEWAEPCQFCKMFSQ